MLAAVGQWIQVCSSVAAGAWLMPWPRVAEQATQIAMVPAVALLSVRNMARVAQNLGVPVIFGGDMGHEHQYRS